MNFQNFSFKAAATAAVAIGFIASAPAANAFSIGDTLQLTSNDVLRFTSAGGVTNIDFGDNGFDGTGANNRGSIFVVAGSTGTFAGYNGANGTVGDLGISPASATPYLNFLQIAPDLFFDLTSFASSTFPIPGPFDVFAVDFRGVFRNTSGQALADGLLTAQLRDATTNGTGSYSFTIEVIPTPALLPGLIAMGVGVVRKRKAAAEESVEAQA